MEESLVSRPPTVSTIWIWNVQFLSRSQTSVEYGEATTLNSDYRSHTTSTSSLDSDTMQRRARTTSHADRKFRLISSASLKRRTFIQAASSTHRFKRWSRMEKDGKSATNRDPKRRPINLITSWSALACTHCQTIQNSQTKRNSRAKSCMQRASQTERKQKGRG